MAKKQTESSSSKSVRSNADNPAATPILTSDDQQGIFEIYKTVFDAANDAILIADTETGIIVDANPEAEKLFERARSEIIGMHQSRLHPQEPEDLYFTLFKQYIEKEKGITGEAEILTRNGSRVPVEISSNVVREEDRTLIVGIFRDISHRQESARALSRSEDRFREVVENIREVFWLFDWSRQKVVYVSPAYENVFGRPVEALYERYAEWSDSIHPDDLEYARASFKRVLETGGGEPREYRIVTPDGSVRWISDIAFAVKDENDQVRRIAGIAEDITERKEFEQQLRLQNAYMLGLHDTAVGLVRRLNVDGLLKDIIKRAARLLDTRNGYLFLADENRKQMTLRVGIGYFESKIGFTLQPGQGLVGRIWESGQPIVLDDYRSWEHRMSEKQFGQLRATCGIPLKSDSDVIGVIGLSHFESEKTFGPDEIEIMSRFAQLAAVALANAQLYTSLAHELAERQQVEKALRLSEERYRVVVEHANDAICIAQDDKFVFHNPRTLELLGCTAEELGRTPFSAFIHPDDLALLLDRYQRRLKGDNPRSTYPVRIISKQGEVRWVQLNAVRIDWEGRPAILGFSRDITEQKTLEVQLQQAQKMEAIGTLAGGIAHDFNNLLMGIQGCTSLMLMDTHPDDPDRDHLTGIEDYVKSAADLTRQLLGFARGGKYEAKPTRLNELIAEKNRMFGRTKKEISIHEKFAADLWNVDVDQGQIEQVLLNIYINAWQAMPGGGDLYVQTENAELDESQGATYRVKPGRHVKISVIDTGIGMDANTLRRIFEPFFTTGPMGRGTGLGMASAFGIIRNHGGHISADSEKGHGTTMNIYLPASSRTITSSSDQPAADFIEGQGTVLLVDDEQLIIDVGTQLLKRLGYRVIKACSGREAVELFRKHRPQIDVVILDMIMPDMGGGQTFDELKVLQPDIKVLLSSGYSLDGEASQILQRGCSAFIQKPYSMKNLSRHLQAVLKQERNLT